jgi:hypothetical protein
MAAIRTTLGSLGILVIAGVTMAGSVAQAGPQRAAAPAKAAASSAGQLVAVAVVPHSSDVWATGFVMTRSGANRYFEVRRHGGRWQKFKPPTFGKGPAAINAVLATSSRAVWIGGARPQSAHSLQTFPAIWQLKGRKFVLVKLPKLLAAASSVASFSASSPTNVWAAGVMGPTTGGFAVLHLSGKKWSAIPVPEEFIAIATTSPTNAWAIGLNDDQVSSLFHWDGQTWTADGTVPGGVSLSGIAAGSPKLVYAVGSIPNPAGGGKTVIMRFNGTTWSMSKIAKGGGSDALLAVSIHGKSAWAIGNHLTPQNTTVPAILHTSGGTWTAQKAPGKVASTLDGIAAASPKRAYAVGTADPGTGDRTLVDLFGGHSWKQLPSKF